MHWPGAKGFAKCFWLVQILGSLSLRFYFHPYPSLGRNPQEHCKCCHTAWKSGRNHRSNKFISIVTGWEPSWLPVAWADLIRASKQIRKNGIKESTRGPEKELAQKFRVGSKSQQTTQPNSNTNVKGSSKFSLLWREWFIISLWPTKPSPPEANVPFESFIIKSSWVHKTAPSHGSPSGFCWPKVPQEGFQSQLFLLMSNIFTPSASP